MTSPQAALFLRWEASHEVVRSAVRAARPPQKMRRPNVRIYVDTGTLFPYARRWVKEDQ